jgi:hypothetical protein
MGEEILKDFATAHQKKSHCWGILILLVRILLQN